MKTKAKVEKFIPFSFKRSTTVEKTIFIGSIIIVLMHLSSIFYQSAFNWGIHFISFLDPVLQIIFILYSVFIFLPTGQKTIYLFLQRIIRFGTGQSKYLKIFSIILISLALFWFFREKVHVFDDGYQNLKIIFKGATETSWLERSSPLTLKSILLANDLLKVIGVIPIKGNWYSVEISFIIISFLSGTIFIFTISEISRLLAKNNIEKTLFFSFMFFSGSSLLFFGHVETYPLQYASISLYILFSLKYLLKKALLIFPIIFYLISYFFHFGTNVLFPTLFFLFIIEYSRKKNTLLTIRYILYFIISFAILFVLSSYSFQKLSVAYSFGSSIIVPLFLKDSYIYSMFSFWHFLDFLNHSLLLNPLSLFLMLTIIVFYKKVITWENPISTFLLIGFIFSIIFEFTFRYAYGVSNSWNVSAPFTVCIVLYPIYLLFERNPIKSTNQWLCSVIIGALLIHFIPWILVNSNENSAIQRAKVLINPKINPIEGIRGIYGQINSFYEITGNTNGRLINSKNEIDLYPDDAYGYHHLWKIYTDIGKTNEANELLHLAENRGIQDAAIENNLGTYYYRKKMYDSAIYKWKKAILYDPYHLDAHINLGMIYERKGNYDTAIIYLEKILQFNTSNYLTYRRLGINYLAKGDTDRTIRAWSKYLELAPMDEYFDKIRVELKKLQSVNKR